MKKDQYIPHEVSIRNTTEVMNLIEKEGMTGYGIYWALLEYLRTQDDYTGDVRVFRALARQLKTSLARLLRILNEYGLFEVDDFRFRSRKLDTVMRPLEEKRRSMAGQSCSDRQTTVQRNARNPLINNTPFSLSKEKERKVYASSEAEKEKAPPYVPAWEQYVDSLAAEEQWKEIMAMRSGLKTQFFTLYPRIVECFKQHVRSIGNEGRILSPADAKHYFCFYITPGSVTHQKLMEQLRTPPDGHSPYEERDPHTGARSYCGIAIPDEAPPRPNAQAVWGDGKWVF